MTPDEVHNLSITPLQAHFLSEYVMMTRQMMPKEEVDELKEKAAERRH